MLDIDFNNNPKMTKELFEELLEQLGNETLKLKPASKNSYYNDYEATRVRPIAFEIKNTEELEKSLSEYFKSLSKADKTATVSAVLNHPTMSDQQKDLLLIVLSPDTELDLSVQDIVKLQNLNKQFLGDYNVLGVVDVIGQEIPLARSNQIKSISANDITAENMEVLHRFAQVHNREKSGALIYSALLRSEEFKKAHGDDIYAANYVKDCIKYNPAYLKEDNLFELAIKAFDAQDRIFSPYDVKDLSKALLKETEKYYTGQEAMRFFELRKEILNTFIDNFSKNMKLGDKPLEIHDLAPLDREDIRLIGGMKLINARITQRNINQAKESHKPYTLTTNEALNLIGRRNELPDFKFENIICAQPDEVLQKMPDDVSPDDEKRFLTANIKDIMNHNRADIEADKFVRTAVYRSVFDSKDNTLTPDYIEYAECVAQYMEQRLNREDNPDYVLVNSWDQIQKIFENQPENPFEKAMKAEHKMEDKLLFCDFVEKINSWVAYTDETNDPLEQVAQDIALYEGALGILRTNDYRKARDFTSRSHFQEMKRRALESVNRAQPNRILRGAEQANKYNDLKEGRKAATKTRYKNEGKPVNNGTFTENMLHRLKVKLAEQNFEKHPDMSIAKDIALDRSIRHAEILRKEVFRRLDKGAQKFNLDIRNTCSIFSVPEPNISKSTQRHSFNASFQKLLDTKKAKFVIRHEYSKDGRSRFD